MLLPLTPAPIALRRPPMLLPAVPPMTPAVMVGARPSVSSRRAGCWLAGIAMAAVL